MEKNCRECMWFRGSDYDFRENFCMPRLEENKFEDTFGYKLRYCKCINESGKCPFWTSINEYGWPGRIYHFFALHSFKLTVGILLLVLLAFTFVKLFG